MMNRNSIAEKILCLYFNLEMQKKSAFLYFLKLCILLLVVQVGFMGDVEELYI